MNLASAPPPFFLIPTVAKFVEIKSNYASLLQLRPVPRHRWHTPWYGTGTPLGTALALPYGWIMNMILRRIYEGTAVWIDHGYDSEENL